ncbi:hypothetical protein [Lonsdalea quercina]|uniref:hypothetical protein n=1 Tax=Lonsdalea quercina TaxID=71657 RepID=UPI003976E4ED
MWALLKPVIVQELGIVTFKPVSELMFFLDEKMIKAASVTCSTLITAYSAISTKWCLQRPLHAKTVYQIYGIELQKSQRKSELIHLSHYSRT